MWQNSKPLISISLLIIVLGLGALWLGLKPAPVPSGTGPAVEPISSPTPTPLVQATSVEGEKALVTRVIDGDTVELENGQTVRLLGIDTPETKDPRKPVGCFGKEATGETKSLLLGKAVILQKDVSETDKYHRLLRYIYLPLDNGQILFVNDYLVREGFAHVLTYPPDVKFNEQLRQAEVEAREGNRGLWAKCM